MLARVISSLQHPSVKKICKLRLDKSYREAEGLIVLNKDAILKEVNQTHPFEELYYLDKSDFHLSLKALKKFAVTESVLEKCLGYKSQDTCVALLKTPPIKNAYRFPWLVLDELQDPGNLGTLLRSALAFDFKTVILLEGSCDPYSDKAIKAARGATFHLEIHQLSKANFLKISQEKQAACLYADAKGFSLKTFKPSEHLALILGNEGHGVDLKLRKGAEAIAIEMNALSESLNVAVAGSILMHALKPR